METTAAVRLPPLLTRFRASYPDVELAISTGPTVDLIERVLAHELDAALVAGPVSHPEIVEEAVLTEEMVLVSAPGRSASRRCHRRPSSSVRAAPPCRLEALLFGAGYGAVRLQELGTLEGILGCVAADLGVTLLPPSVAGRYESAGMVRCYRVPPTARP